MKKSVLIALAAAGCVLATAAAEARTNVSWAIGINAAPIGIAVSNGPVYAPAPVYFEPAPVYVEPAPVYLPAPVVYAPPRVVYRPVPVVYGRGYYGPSPVVYGGYGRYWDARARVWRQHDHNGWRDGDHRRYPHQ